MMPALAATFAGSVFHFMLLLADFFLGADGVSLAVSEGKSPIGLRAGVLDLLSFRYASGEVVLSLDGVGRFMVMLFPYTCWIGLLTNFAIVELLLSRPATVLDGAAVDEARDAWGTEGRRFHDWVLDFGAFLGRRCVSGPLLRFCGVDAVNGSKPTPLEVETIVGAASQDAS